MAQKSIKIIRTPRVPAPKSIRDAWIGVILPLAAPSKREIYAHRSFSRTLNSLADRWYKLIGRFPKSEGYIVESAIAIAILERSNPSAAAWWRNRVPYLLAPKRYFLFEVAACEEIAEEHYD